MAEEQQIAHDELVARLDRITDLMALTLVRGLEQDEQIRILSAAGYAPARIGTFLGVRPNTVSVALSRARKKPTPRRKKTTRQGAKSSRSRRRSGN